MEKRSYTMMTMYLQGPCRGIAEVVSIQDAEIDIIDADFPTAKDLLDARNLKTPDRPLILLSLEEINLEQAIYVKKPVQANQLINAIEEAIARLQDSGLNSTDKAIKQQLASEENSSDNKQENSKPVLIDRKQAGKKHINKEELKKTSKHRSAMNLTEEGFNSYLGHVEGINFAVRNQVLNASYDPKQFFLGYVLSALKMAREKELILQLNSSWKPLIIFPHSHEIWLDASDQQLRAFSGMIIQQKSGQTMSLSPINPKASKFNQKMEKFYDIDAFIWKLTLWTSKGRYPVAIDINKPVYLKHWPNFTRLIITPHALQIAAILMMCPKTLMEIIDSLKINPQYVFVFISAAHALNLVGQAERLVDEKTTESATKKSKSKGILSRILSRLRRPEKKNNNDSV